MKRKWQLLWLIPAAIGYSVGAWYLLSYLSFIGFYPSTVLETIGVYPFLMAIAIGNLIISIIGFVVGIVCTLIFIRKYFRKGKRRRRKKKK